MKVAILGVWHVHAGGYTKTAKELGEVVGVYDENAEWRAKFAKEFGIREFSTAEELYNSDAEGVIVCAATNRHADYIVDAANHGKHIFTEKVLALTEEDCLRCKEAVDRNGVNFVISFPWKFNPAYMALKKVADDGTIGDINFVRFRNCHSGSVGHWLPPHFYNKEQCGGGAMIDLGAHGMYLAHWFLGEPTGYTSAFAHFCRDEKDAEMNPQKLEDNAVTVMKYDNGAIAVNETGFVSNGCKETLEIGGTKGYLTSDGVNAFVAFTKTEVNALELSQAKSKPIESFMKGESIDGCGMSEAIALTRMMIGAYGNTIE